MTNNEENINEEKIKAFLKDEEKVKALMNDKKFIEKVSNREDTPETYKDTLEKLGLEISIDEAKQIQDIVRKIFDTPTEKLDNDFLKNISGGKGPYAYAGSNDNTENNTSDVSESGGSGLSRGINTRGIGIGLALGGACCLSGLGCVIAGLVYAKKAREATEEYDAEKYAEKAMKLADTGIFFNGIAMGSGVGVLTMLYGNNR